MATIKLKRAAAAGASLTYGEMAIGGNELYFGNSSNLPVKMSKDGHTHTAAQITNFNSAVLALSPDGPRTPISHSLNSHSDVAITSPSSGQVLKFNGSSWVNSTDSNTNNYVSGMTGNGNSTLTLTRSGLSNLTLNLAHSHSWSDVPAVSGISVIGKSTTGAGVVSELGVATLQSMLNLGTAAYTASTAYKASSYKPTWSEVTGKPTFVAVATSGSYNDLSDKPTIPTIPSILPVSEGTTGTASTQRTISASHLKQIILALSPAGARQASDVKSWAKADNKPSYGWSEVTGKPTFVAVATSGSYVDLSNKPTIPTIPDVLSVSDGTTGTSSAQKTINASNLKSIILAHSPAGARQASDVKSWAKADNKPTYTYSEVGAAPATHSHSATEMRVGGISVIGKSDTGGGSTQELGMTALKGMLGLGSLAYSSATIPTTTSQLTNNSNFITSSSSITGNAATATKLAAPVKINGTNFDGSEAITITAAPTAHNQVYTTINSIPTGRVLGRNTAGSGAAEAITYANLKSYMGLGNVDNTSDLSKPISTAQQAALDNKVDKVTNKGLSTNDYTTTEKNKLAGIASNAEVNVQSDWNATSGDALILNKPTIPTSTNQLTNDSGYITSLGSISGNAATATLAANSSKLNGQSASYYQTASTAWNKLQT